jgi:adenine/guanine/hypoxanthine permease
VGTIIAWGSTAFGANYGGLSLKGLTDSVSNFGFHVPLPAFSHVFSGFEFLGILLITAIPFGIYDLVEAIDNVESAEVAGDSFPTTRVLTADGIVSLIGCMMGNPFINAVYIGHPGWKAMGGRIGYSAGTGIMVILLCWFGTISVMLALIPAVAILPILLYIGMLIGSQAFQETPKRHAPAVVLALVPHMASWGIVLINGALAAAGTIVATLSPEQISELAGKLKNEGVLYHGMHVLGGGSILSGLILGAVAAFIIDRNFMKASGFAFAGALMTFFGFMHGEKIGFAQTPVVAVSYLAVSLLLLGCAKFVVVVTEQPKDELEEGEVPAESVPA